MADLKAFADQLVNLTVKEVNELAQILKDDYGIEPAAAAVAMVGPAAGDAAPVVAEKTSFDVVLKAAFSFVISVIISFRKSLFSRINSQTADLSCSLSIACTFIMFRSYLRCVAPR